MLKGKQKKIQKNLRSKSTLATCPPKTPKESQVFKKCLRANIFEYEFFQPMQKQIPSHDPTAVEF